MDRRRAAFKCTLVLTGLLFACGCSVIPNRQPVEGAAGGSVVTSVTLSADEAPVDSLPKLLSDCRPAYPRLAATAGLEGTALIKVLVSESGTALRTEIEKGSGAPSLDDSAIRAASRCQYKPAIRSGSPVLCWIVYHVEFKLD